MLEGKDKIIKLFEKLPGALEEAQDKLAERHAEVWRLKVPKRSHRYEKAISAHDAVHILNAREVLADTADNAEVVYSDVVERGRKDGVNYPGQFVVRDALDEVNRSAREFFDTPIEAVLMGF
jgi:hypothetical protein